MSQHVDCLVLDLDKVRNLPPLVVALIDIVVNQRQLSPSHAVGSTPAPPQNRHCSDLHPARHMAD